MKNAIAKQGKLRHILLVDDNPGDIRLTLDAIREANRAVQVHVARNGAEALAYLHHIGMHLAAPRPDLILLDLNMPAVHGNDILSHIKEDEGLRTIPVIILSISDAREDILTSYRRQANAYLRKPIAVDEFRNLIQSVCDFWLTSVKLPRNRSA